MGLGAVIVTPVSRQNTMIPYGRDKLLYVFGDNLLSAFDKSKALAGSR